LEIEDFPYEVQIAFRIYNLLGDNVQANIGYVGKFFNNLPTLLDLHAGSIDKELIIDIISWLDSRMIKKSSDDMEKELKKARGKYGR
jgi:hypothetical protein